MATKTTRAPTTEAVTPLRIESRPSEGPTVRSSRYVRPAGNAPARRTSARSLASSGVKLPLMMPESVIRSSILGADCTRLSRMMASCLPMLAPVAAPNFWEPAAVRKNEIVEEPNCPCAGRAFFKSRPGDDRLLVDQVKAALVAARLGARLDELEVLGDLPCLGGQQRGLRRGPAVDQRKLQEGGVLDEVLDALGVVDPGQLHEDPVGALPRDQRLGNAELVDAVADGLHGLGDRIVLELAARGVLQREGPLAAAGAVGPVRQEALDRPPRAWPDRSSRSRRW